MPGEHVLGIYGITLTGHTWGFSISYGLYSFIIKKIYLFVSTFTHKFVSSTLIIFRMESCHRLTNLYFVWLIFRMVNGLSLKWNLFPFVLHRWIRHLFYLFGTEFNLICCCSIEFCLVSIIYICTSCRPLRIDLKRHVTFFVLCFIIERSLFLCIFVSDRVLLWLNFISFIIMIIGSFQYIWVVMSLLNFKSARLVSLGCDMISSVIMMVCSLSNKLDVFGRTVVFTWIKIKYYHMCRFGKRIFNHSTQKGPYYR